MQEESPRDVGESAAATPPHRLPRPPPPCRRAPAPHPTPLRQEISLGSLVSPRPPALGRPPIHRRGGQTPQARRPRRRPARRSGPAAPGPVHLHLFAEVARPGHCRRPGAAAAAAPAVARTPAAPASRQPRGPLGPALGSPPSVSRSVSPLRFLSDTGAGCFGTQVSSAKRQPRSRSASAALAAEPSSSFPPVRAAAAPQ